MAVERLAHYQYHIGLPLAARHWLIVLLQRLGATRELVVKPPVRKHRLPDVPHGIALYGCVPCGNPVVVGFGIGSVEGGMPQHH